MGRNDLPVAGEPAGAGPGPIGCLIDQATFDRVFVDVLDDRPRRSRRIDVAIVSAAGLPEMDLASLRIRQAPQEGRTLCS